jgi:uncharacterized protein YjbJ (UPF0337 family)
MSPEISRLKGRINRWLGVATGDRKQEAIGSEQERTGRKPDTEQVDRAVKQVKAGHHDYGERIPPQRVHHADRNTT